MASKFRKRKPRVGRSQIEAEALRNALADRSIANYEAIFEGFEEMGIPMEEVRPRENVFTYHAWRALGRQVRKGAHGVKVVTFITKPVKGSQTEQGEDMAEGDQPKERKFSRSVTVFHISQTDPMDAPAVPVASRADGLTATA
jgi:antirestriction protein ArdC